MGKYLFSAILFLCGLILLNVAVYHVLKKPPQKGGTRAEMFDAGEVIQGAIITRTFALRNDSDTPLVIEKIVHSCSCLVSDINRGDTVAPHSEYRFSLSMNTKGYAGKVFNNVLLVTGNGKSDFHEFGIKCVVKVPFVIMPKELFFPDVIQGVPDEHVVSLKSNMRQDIAITDVKPSVDYLACAFAKSADGWNIRVAVTPNAPLGFHNTTVEVFTTLPDVPAVIIPVSCNVTAEVICEPSTIAFGHVSRAGQNKIYGEIYAKNNSSVRFVSATTTSDDVTVTASATEHNDSQRIGVFCVQISKNAPREKAITTGLRIHSTSRLTPEIVVPVSFFISSEYHDID